MSVKEACKKFWQLEEKYNLLDFSVDDTKPWQAIRIHIYLDIVAKTKIFDKHINIVHKVGISDHITFFISWLYGCIFKNPFLNFSKKDILIIEHQRKKWVNNEQIDIYTQYYIDELLNKKEKFEVYCFHHYHAGTSDRKFNKYSLDILTLIYRMVKIFIRPKITHENKNKIKQVEKEIENLFGVKFNLYNALRKSAQIIKVKYPLWLLLLKIKKPQKIVLLVSYGWAEVIRAAKKLKIPVVEWQHGTFSQFHLGYSFPGRNPRKPLEYFPDYLCVWGDYWRKITPLPLPKERIIVTGFTYFNLKIKEKKGVTKNNSITLLSQGGIGNELANFILNNMTYLCKYKIFYKLHPSEYKIWKQYNNLVSLSKFECVEIVESDAIELYDLLSQSKYQIGVFSTALYEGIGLECKTFIVKLSGWEYMENLIENKYAIGLEPVTYSYDFIEKAIKENILQFDVQELFYQPECSAL